MVVGFTIQPMQGGLKMQAIALFIVGMALLCPITTGETIVAAIFATMCI